jgi:hypothetical protein
MRVVKQALGILAFVLALMPGRGMAQYVHEVDPMGFSFRNQMRYEIGGGIIMPMGEFHGVARAVNPNGGYIGDTTLSRTLDGAMGINFTLGLSIPFKGTGHISCWALKVELMLNQYMWNDLNKQYKDGSFYAASTPLNATTQNIMMPLGIEYKVGNDAILSKRLYFGASFGAGLIPQYNRTFLEGVTNINPQGAWGLTPYGKFEFSTFAGLCWKFRFMYTIGDVNLIDVNHQVARHIDDAAFAIKSKSNFIASLIIMPFSYQWQETDWWNTYDTYNQQDRFN